MSETINLKNTRMTTNYDLNIWDRLSHETGGEKTGGWEIEIYTIEKSGSFYGSGIHLEDKTIKLTPEESKQLTLGWGEDLGGDYAEDDDFWLDKETFFDIYKDVPDRVAEILNSLPEYETENFTG